MSRWKQPQNNSEGVELVCGDASNFKASVLATVRTIRRGQTMTYQQVATLAGKPRAYRAVGNILHNNYDKSVPCHRVILSSGAPGGYNRGGLNKAKLLAQEGIVLSEEKNNLK